jgi:hypothetical protein
LAGGGSVGTRFARTAMDWTTISVIIGTITTAAAGAAGWFGREGVAAWIKVRETNRVDEEIAHKREDQEEEKEDNTLRYIIGRLEGELASLRIENKEMRESHRTELGAVYTAHNECERRFAKLDTEFRLRMEYLGARCDRIEAQAQHTNKQVAENKEAVAQAKGDSKVILEVHSDKFLLPDGTELDPNNPRDAALIERWQERKADMDARRAKKDEQPAV